MRPQMQRQMQPQMRPKMRPQMQPQMQRQIPEIVKGVCVCYAIKLIVFYTNDNPSQKQYKNIILTYNNSSKNKQNEQHPILRTV